MRSSLLCPFAVAVLVLLTSQLLFNGAVRKSARDDTLAYALLFAVEDQGLLNQAVPGEEGAPQCSIAATPAKAEAQGVCAR